MSKKYFVTSDVHSFFTPFKKALREAGFRKTNPDHILVICGDVFDRGKETNEVFEYIQSIPKKRRILIKGNHEYLFEDLLDKWFPERHDFSNGTVRTFCDIAGVDIKKLDFSFWYSQARKEGHTDVGFYYNKPYEYWEIIKEKVKNSKVNQWINSKEWKDYYEIGKYVLVHSFIPTKIKEEYEPFRYIMGSSSSPECSEYDPYWRSNKNWYDAVWGCPWAQYKEGLFAPETAKGKVLVCGHWHAYDFRIHLDGVKYKTKGEIDFSAYISKDIIALDACTVVSNICNVFTIDEE